MNKDEWIKEQIAGIDNPIERMALNRKLPESDKPSDEPKGDE